MKISKQSFTHLSPRERRKLLFPVGLTALIVEIILLLQSLNEDIALEERLINLAVGLVVILYTWLLVRFLYPFSARHPGMHWLIALINGLGIPLLTVGLAGVGGVLTIVLTVAYVTVSAVLSGRGPTYLFIFTSTALGIAILAARPSSDILEWASVLSLPLMSAMINETILRLSDAIRARMERLETITRVSQGIASSIEVRQVIDLVSQAVQEALLADTYYMGLLEVERLPESAKPDEAGHDPGASAPLTASKHEMIHLELFYDNGEFFPPQDVPLENSLASYVINNRRPLLLRDVQRESARLGLSTTVIGQPRTSQSWMGVPMLAGTHLVGLLAVASYRRNVFDESDLELMENLAQQAAFVIDNARHHEEVERQSRLDSLTEVYNHIYFLQTLVDAILHSRSEGTALSLIMLDIDLFKHYNDTYGHLVGDQALRQVVAAMRGSIRSGDAIGRWGGEEFAILLPGTSGEGAAHVARRIQQNLASRMLPGQDGHTIPAPTVSQGIAVFPQEAGEAEKLVDLADKRLYQAKARGRNQIEPDFAYWNQMAFPDI